MLIFIPYKDRVFEMLPSCYYSGDILPYSLFFIKRTVVFRSHFRTENKPVLYGTEFVYHMIIQFIN